MTDAIQPQEAQREAQLAGGAELWRDILDLGKWTQDVFSRSNKKKLVVGDVSILPRVLDLEPYDDGADVPCFLIRRGASLLALRQDGRICILVGGSYSHGTRDIDDPRTYRAVVGSITNTLAIIYREADIEATVLAVRDQIESVFFKIGDVRPIAFPQTPTPSEK
jgi:hypothetical protein